MSRVHSATESLEFVNGFSHDKFVNQIRNKSVVSLAEETLVKDETEKYFKLNDKSGETFADCAVGRIQINCFIQLSFELLYPTRYFRPLCHVCDAHPVYFEFCVFQMNLSTMLFTLSSNSGSSMFAARNTSLEYSP